MDKFNVTLKMSDGETIKFVKESMYEILVQEITEGNNGWIEYGDGYINSRYVKSFSISPFEDEADKEDQNAAAVQALRGMKLYR
ncbi:hypothetical protein DUZ99_02110 [Xylanibacillus composti]|uniref:Uncharacterized protein n=1 Tax=Xylanibacillus composti TaxID=1572762 RepID=A0A8J4M029_9BACL|nr:hypothetical protein [Xylanibacillus composti]MDT9723789.1 hypothetical protein [Xylanibacillus composti]GIQ67440.1 hypothetical protein XYCOK13_02640 [Xylanibacillus composti]